MYHNLQSSLLIVCMTREMKISPEGDHMIEKLSGIGHVAISLNHWSNQWTSIDLLEKVIVPDYMVQKKKHNLDVNHAAVLLLDCWWGWLDKTFIDHTKTKYPWIKLVYVPPACTPIGQPQDGGTIAKVKAILRNLTDQSIMQAITKWIQSGKSASNFTIDMGAQKVKQELTLFFPRLPNQSQKISS